jgi:hypothetical protein
MGKNIEQSREQYRFGIGEWYGKSFINLPDDERSFFANIQHQKKKNRPPMPCPPRSSKTLPINCTKEGGVCSIRLYKLSRTGIVEPHHIGGLVTTCPYRFYEDNIIFKWVGETVIGHSVPIIVNEVGFLERPKNNGISDDVGRIDIVLVNPMIEPLAWCALEMQAVYFSGDAMKREFDSILDYKGKGIPFPSGKRRPDYRSSGPKRLMPQLQIKVPTLRRWGRKMAVVVDNSFFTSIGEMDHVGDISNADIAWFVVKYKEQGKNAVLEPSFVRFTTLERTVEGLTGGIPVSLIEFEKRIKLKLKK